MIFYRQLNQTQSKALQTIQGQQAQLLATIAAMGPSLQTIPLRIDAAKMELGDRIRDIQNLHSCAPSQLRPPLVITPSDTPTSSTRPSSAVLQLTTRVSPSSSPMRPRKRRKHSDDNDRNTSSQSTNDATSPRRSSISSRRLRSQSVPLSQDTSGGLHASSPFLPGSGPPESSRSIACPTSQQSTSHDLPASGAPAFRMPEGSAQDRTIITSATASHPSALVISATSDRHAAEPLKHPRSQLSRTQDSVPSSLPSTDLKTSDDSFAATKGLEAVVGLAYCDDATLPPCLESDPAKTPSQARDAGVMSAEPPPSRFLIGSEHSPATSLPDHVEEQHDCGVIFPPPLEQIPDRPRHLSPSLELSASTLQASGEQPETGLVDLPVSSSRSRPRFVWTHHSAISAEPTGDMHPGRPMSLKDRKALGLLAHAAVVRRGQHPNSWRQTDLARCSLQKENDTSYWTTKKMTSSATSNRVRRKHSVSGSRTRWISCGGYKSREILLWLHVSYVRSCIKEQLVCLSSADAVHTAPREVFCKGETHNLQLLESVLLINSFGDTTENLEVVRSRPVCGANVNFFKCMQKQACLV